MELWSSAFLSETPDWATCSVNLPTWQRITEENEGAKRLFAQISVGEKAVYCPVGAPHHSQEGGTTEEDGKLYLPRWALDRLGVDGCGEVAEVEWLTEEAFPEATRIVVRPHDSAFFHGDAKEDLERAFTRLGVLQLGMTVEVPLAGLGGFEVAVDLVTLEPAHLVLAEGDEVAIEFQEALDASGAAVTTTAAAVTPVAVEAAPEDAFAVLPSAPTSDRWATAGKGYTLGGASRNRPPMADGRPWNPWRQQAATVSREG